MTDALAPFREPATVERARRLAAMELCARCIGRPFAKLGHGLSNDKRGRAVASEAGLAVASDDECASCRGVFAHLDAYVRVATQTVAGHEFASFLVGTRVARRIEAAEEALFGATGAETSEPIQTELNREIGKRLEPVLGKRADPKKPDITIIVDTRFHVAELQVAPLFVYGRYRKLARGIPQARWPCGVCGGTGCNACAMTGKQYAESVQAFVDTPAIEAARGASADFHGMGREDIDARCLGRGRPFVVEIKQPRARSIDLVALERAINDGAHGRVEVEGLRWSSRDEVVRIKESRGKKTYRALVGFETPPNPEKLKEGVAALPALAIAQRTPSRVEHRRAMLVRERRVLEADLESVSGAQAVIRVRGEAGLYIKELVSGDEGRTTPSLSELVGVPCRVLELDVLDVEEQ
jgi:tRNA pseudouridine synthase 10